MNESAGNSAENLLLVASYVGYQADTLLWQGQTFTEFRLKAADNFTEVVIQGTREGVRISNATAIKTENITSEELKKAACCDLAGCFETQSTVQPQVTNVVTNARELRILGLSGVYNQVLIDGLPMIQGLTYTYGISSVPGTLVQNIFVAKGANSVLQGFESISGQINVETKSGSDPDRLMLNAYINNFGEKHFNANAAYGQGKWNNLTALHVVQPANRIDRDDDGFMDLPLLTRYLISNKWQYGKEADWGWSSTVGLRYMHEERVGGQLSYRPARDAGGDEVYGQQVRIAQPEVYTKTAYRFNSRSRLALLASSFRQEQQSWFGTVRYEALQTNAYANVQYEHDYGKVHTFKTGLSYRYLNLREDIGIEEAVLDRTYAGRYHRVEYLPGACFENTMQLLNAKLTWVAGLRADHHNEFGTTLTPRTLLKYDLDAQSTIRASAGTGWRTVNLFSENIGILASSRNVIFAEALRPERAANYGVNYTRNYTLDQISGFISADYYHTRFSNQVFPDYDSNPREALIANFGGHSAANGFQTEVLVRWDKRYEAKVGYNYLDVFRKEDGLKQQLPFNARHKVLTALHYRPLNDKFQCDANVHWYGRQRLPSTRLNPEEFQRPDYSERYTVVNLQFTWFQGAFEFYGGCENLFDFRQLQPILGWEEPFGPYFDTAFVWGPTRGRELYAGVRYRLKR